MKTPNTNPLTDDNSTSYQEPPGPTANAQRVSLVASGNVDPGTMNPHCGVRGCKACDGTGFSH